MVALGRTQHAPDIFGSGEGGVGTDLWQINITANNVDQSGHPMFHSLMTTDEAWGALIDMLENPAGLHREDHNCMWMLDNFGGHDKFCNDNNAEVHGTWGHDGGQIAAGIVEFHPRSNASAPRRAIAQDKIDSRKGTILTNGLAACEWDCPTDGGANGVNLHQGNLENMTTNALSYLSPKAEVVIPAGVDNVDADDMSVAPVYYNLQGIRVENPAAGIFIKVVGNNSYKLYID